MKKKISLFLIVIFLLSLTSCQDLTETNAPHLLQTACVYYSVPGFYQLDLKGIHTEVIETDDFGRTLLYQKKHSRLTDKEEGVYVICQKQSDSTVYFYEDINYAWENEALDLQKLKEENDWNTELQESKCSSRYIRVSFDLSLISDSPFEKFDDERFYSSLQRTHGIAEDAIRSVGFCDEDGGSNAVYFINLQNGEKYFCIVDAEYNTYVSKIKDPYNVSNEIINLKRLSNWSYGS